MFRRRLSSVAVLRAVAGACVIAVVMGLASRAHAVSIAIVNGSSSTSEFLTTTAITNNLAALATLQGYSSTVYDTPPADLSPFDQVWDLRFSNASPLSTTDKAQYLAYLQSGKGMFIMGENANFMSRNNSILDFINNDLGAGTVTFNPVFLGYTDGVVQPPYTGPNAIGSNIVNFAAPGVVSTLGTGDAVVIRSGASDFIGIGFSGSDLTNAPGGTLVTVFDVNFMQNEFDLPDSNQFTRNLLGFIQDQVDPTPTPTGAVPEPITASLGLLSLGAVALATRRRRA